MGACASKTFGSCAVSSRWSTWLLLSLLFVGIDTLRSGSGNIIGARDGRVDVIVEGSGLGSTVGRSDERLDGRLVGGLDGRLDDEVGGSDTTEDVTSLKEIGKPSTRPKARIMTEWPRATSGQSLCLRSESEFVLQTILAPLRR